MSSRFPTSTMINVMRRYQPQGDAEGNRALLNDPSAIEEVPEQDREEVDYPRPPFNWPERSIPQANSFVIDSMALDVLSKAGFNREARSLQTRLRCIETRGSELPAILHRYLDFAPAPKLPEEKIAALAELAEQMGLDPDSIRRAPKKPVTNPLAHSCSTLGEEWSWLRANAKAKSPFGKSAACELSASAAAALAARWIGELGTPDMDPDDPAPFNRAWFDREFPFGWTHVDRLGEAALVSAPFRDFPARVLAIAYEIASKALRGWDPAETARFGFDHMNLLGVTGSALIAQEAFDYFNESVVPQLSRPRAAPATPSALSAHMARCNPGLSAQSDEMLAWMAYRLADPKSAGAVEEIWRSDAAKKGPDIGAAKLAAIFERFELLTADARLLIGGPPPTLAPSSPARPRL